MNKKLAIYQDRVNNKMITLLYYLDEEVEQALDNYCNEAKVLHKDMERIVYIDAPDVFTIEIDLNLKEKKL
nr:MAG TPA: hypothetical protein [Crassvirales sp.]